MLNDGDIDEIGVKVQETTVETWDGIDDHYGVIQQGIAAFKALPQKERQLEQTT